MKCPDCQNGWYLGAGLKPPERCTTCKGTNEVLGIVAPDVEKLRALRKAANRGYPTGLKMQGTKTGRAAATPAPAPDPDDDLAHRITLLTDLLKDVARHLPLPKGIALPIDGPPAKKDYVSVVTIQPQTTAFFRPTGVRLFASPGQYQIQSVDISGWRQIPAPVDASFFACLFGACWIKWGCFSNVACCHPLNIEYETLADNVPPLRGYIVGEEVPNPPTSGCGVLQP